MQVPSLVYVLECESAPGDPARYYVGHTANLQRRFEEHASGRGSAWTAKHRPIRPIEIRMGGDAEETQLTLDYMERCGIDYVRGGPWTTVTLPAATVTVIQQQLRSASGACYKCGGAHFAAACSVSATRPCPIEAEFLADAQPAPTLRQSLIELAASITGFGAAAAPAAPQPTPRRKDMLCERCGRNNHMVDNCYAKSHHFSGATTECRRCGRLHSATCYYKTDIDGEQLR